MKKLLLTAVIALSISSVGTAKAEAADRDVMENIRIEESEDNGIVTYADVIVRKYRINNGQRQYRRWNSTKNCWVDPYWINF